MEKEFYQGLIIIIFIIAILIFDKKRRAKKRREVAVKINQHNKTEQSSEDTEIIEGSFSVTGFQHLNKKSKEVAIKVKSGDLIQLKPSFNNQYDDTAIRVLSNGVEIGWVERSCGDKDEMFDILEDGGAIACTCLSSYYGDYIVRVKGNDDEWSDKNLGKAQLIEVEYKYMEQ